MRVYFARMFLPERVQPFIASRMYAVTVAVAVPVTVLEIALLVSNTVVVFVLLWVPMMGLLMLRRENSASCSLVTAPT